jgi:hypothetical protein
MFYSPHIFFFFFNIPRFIHFLSLNFCIRLSNLRKYVQALFLSLLPLHLHSLLSDLSIPPHVIFVLSISILAKLILS